jgi:hypothetical protein
MRLFASYLAAAGVLGVVALAPTVASAVVRYNDYYDQGESGFGVYVETPSADDYYGHGGPDSGVAVGPSDPCKPGYYGCYVYNPPYRSTRR